MMRALEPRATRFPGRSSRGTVLAEFIPALIMLVLLALLCANLGLTLFAAWVNDAAARDGVRAASQQSTSDAALKAAQVAVQQHAQSCSWFNGPTVLTDPNSFKFERFPDANGNSQRAKGPYATVTTTMTVTFPAPIIYHDARMTDTLNLKQSYSFPLVNP